MRPGRFRIGRGARFLSSVVLVGLAAACGGGSPAGVVRPDEVEVTLTPLDGTAERVLGLELVSRSGSDVTLQVVGVGLAGVTGAAFDLRFDPALLEFESADAGSFFGPEALAGAKPLEGADGTLLGVAAEAPGGSGRSGSGALLTLTFSLRQLRDAETVLIFASPESQAYGGLGPAADHSFVGARLVTRIVAPR